MSLLQYEDYLPSHDENCESEYFEDGEFYILCKYVLGLYTYSSLLDWINKTLNKLKSALVLYEELWYADDTQSYQMSRISKI